MVPLVKKSSRSARQVPPHRGGPSEVGRTAHGLSKGAFLDEKRPARCRGAPNGASGPTLAAGLRRFRSGRTESRAASRLPRHYGREGLLGEHTKSVSMAGRAPGVHSEAHRGLVWLLRRAGRAQEVMKDLDVSPSDEPYLIRRPSNTPERAWTSLLMSLNLYTIEY